VPHNQRHWCRSFWTRRFAAVLPRAAASRCCLALLPSFHRLVSDGESDVTRVPRLPVSPMVSSRQMKQNRRQRHATLTPPTSPSLPPFLLLSVSIPFFKKAIWRLGVETKLLLVSVFVETRQRKRCPRPSGKWYNEDPYADTLPHFNCKRCTHPALWTGDGCIMGRAQDMTVHHACARRAACSLPSGTLYLKKALCLRFEKVWYALDKTSKCCAYIYWDQYLLSSNDNRSWRTRKTIINRSVFFGIIEQRWRGWTQQLAGTRWAVEWHAGSEVNSHVRRATAPNSQFTHTGPTS